MTWLPKNDRPNLSDEVNATCTERGANRTGYHTAARFIIYDYYPIGDLWVTRCGNRCRTSRWSQSAGWSDLKMRGGESEIDERASSSSVVTASPLVNIGKPANARRFRTQREAEGRAGVKCCRRTLSTALQRSPTPSRGRRFRGTAPQRRSYSHAHPSERSAAAAWAHGWYPK
jgi:hypothetical protein